MPGGGAVRLSRGFALRHASVVLPARSRSVFGSSSVVTVVRPLCSCLLMSLVYIELALLTNNSEVLF